jgi:glutaredoxin 3
MKRKVLMYCTAACPFCQAAERLLREKGVAIDKVRVDLEPGRRAEMTQKANGRRTVPQIWIGERHVGGCDDLYELDRNGELDPLLEAAA